ncbi:hypothetical protein ACFLV0_06330, partial [Chloroflexota bacterium]
MTMARVFGQAEGITQRVAEYPNAILNNTEAEIRKNIEKATFPQIVDALTKPAKKMEVGAKAGIRDIVFKGTIDEVNNFFQLKGWSDGLSITPPTIDRVEKFLEYTDILPQEEIAILPAAKLRATSWNIAVNAIMAGCRPEHIPVLIAAVEAMGAPKYNITNIGTTGAEIPYFIVGGPIVKKLGIEYGIAATSRGPNPV